MRSNWSPPRFARPADTEAMSLLVAQSVQAFPEGAYTERQINKWYDYYSAANLRQKLPLGIFFVQEDQGVVIGMIGYLDDEVVGLYVLPSYRRQGVAQRLHDHLEHHLRQEGVLELSLTATPAAEPFYLHNGYRIVALERLDIEGVYFWENRMTKTL